MGLSLEIDELVVEGVAESDSEELFEVIERELTALFGSNAVTGGSLEIPGGVFEIPPDLDPDEIGQRVAEAIWNSCQAA